MPLAPPVMTTRLPFSPLIVVNNVFPISPTE
jgi:hypothetical protein